MGHEPTAWDYLLVSDLHLSIGYDAQLHAYHPREDFFFDEAFFRWLRWADETCAPGRRWELVFVGDTFDFLPVDESVLRAYLAARETRAQVGEDPQQLFQYWREALTAPPPPTPLARRAQRLLFEEDVRRGLVHLAPLTPEQARALGAKAHPVPEWAMQIYLTYHPETLTEADVDRTFVLRPPSPGMYAARRAGEPATDRGRGPDQAFEERYGFLPTPQRSADKLESIYNGHPLFFRALAWFVGQGHRVVFLRGNHDIDLYWPQVQARLRTYIAREYRAAYGLEKDHPLPEGLEERICFEPGWFLYRRGAFYAEHGAQYEALNAVPDPIRPVLQPGGGPLLNLPVGSLGVICFHNHLEDRFPEWENLGAHAVVLRDLLRRYPFDMLALLIRRGADFARMARLLWRATKRTAGRPSEEDLAWYAWQVGLEVETVRRIYDLGARPLLTRRALAWFLFSPAGHAVKLSLMALLVGVGIVAAAAWYLVVVPALGRLLPSSIPVAAVRDALRLLTEILLWTAPPLGYAALRRWFAARYGEPGLVEAARRLHRAFRETDPDLLHFVFGHSHLPSVRPIGYGANGQAVLYLNTGTWTPAFSEGRRHLLSLGQPVQFTFLRLTQTVDGYRADLLRWNDDAGRPERQILAAGDGPTGRGTA